MRIKASPQQVLTSVAFANISSFQNLVLKLWRQKKYLYSSQISPRLKCTVCTSAKKFASRSRGKWTQSSKNNDIQITSSFLCVCVSLQTVHLVIYPWTFLVSGQASFCHLAFSQAPSFSISQCKH